jgi:hypothetical protein
VKHLEDDSREVTLETAKCLAAVVDEQRDLPRRALEMGLGQTRLTQRCGGHRERIDRIRLAEAAGAPCGRIDAGTFGYGTIQM